MGRPVHPRLDRPISETIQKMSRQRNRINIDIDEYTILRLEDWSASVGVTRTELCRDIVVKAIEEGLEVGTHAMRIRAQREQANQARSQTQSARHQAQRKSNP
jgi:DNA transposition AAA+ family ATPase